MVGNWVVWSILGAIVATPPAGPQAGTGPAGTSQPVREIPLEGFWPTSRMVEALLHRWAAAAEEAYALSPSQHQKLEAQLLERWPKFLNEHRTEWQPLLNDYLEARMAPDPPSVEAVQRWARRAAPQFEEFRRFIDEGNEQFAALLTVEQQAKFEADRSRLAQKWGALRTRMPSWERGEFQKQEWLDLTRPPGTGGRTNPAPAAPETQPADEFELEMAAWDRFVREFAAQYHLDAGQRDATASILAEMKARASDHYRSRKLRIALLEELIRYPKLDTTEAEIEAELIELYGPLDEMFQELDRRLRSIPTEAQVRRAQQK
ncbi:MAG: hypothetical protein V2A79_19225 [Planctomycetota bacterium]